MLAQHQVSHLLAVNDQVVLPNIKGHLRVVRLPHAPEVVPPDTAATTTSSLVGGWPLPIWVWSWGWLALSPLCSWLSSSSFGFITTIHCWQIESALLRARAFHFSLSSTEDKHCKTVLLPNLLGFPAHHPSFTWAVQPTTQNASKRAVQPKTACKTGLSSPLPKTIPNRAVQPTAERQKQRLSSPMSCVLVFFSKPLTC